MEGAIRPRDSGPERTQLPKDKRAELARARAEATARRRVQIGRPVGRAAAARAMVVLVREAAAGLEAAEMLIREAAAGLEAAETGAGAEAEVATKGEAEVLRDGGGRGLARGLQSRHGGYPSRRRGPVPASRASRCRCRRLASARVLYL